MRVLVQLGWLPSFWTDADCTLEFGDRQVTVPRDAFLEGERLVAILAEAGIGPLQFIDRLESMRQDGMRAYADIMSSK